MSKNKNQKTSQEAPANNLQKTSRQIISAEFHGPIPPPSTLAQYEQIKPGFAERIISMAEKQSDHRRELESKALKYSVSEVRLGQILGFSIALIGLVCATIIAIYGYQTTASIIGG